MKFALGAYADAVEVRLAGLVRDGAAERIWRHDATFWGGDADRQRSVANRLGWLDVATEMCERLPELERFAREVRDAGMRDAVLLGMGGSSLAPEVLRQSIAEPHGEANTVGLRLHVLDTTDPATIMRVTRTIDPARALFFVSSKSGTTIEALSLFAYFHALVGEAKGERAGENFAAITDAGTPLETMAREHGFRRVFTNPGDIGGRYSALSYFGLVPAAVAGVNVSRLLERGIAAADDAKAPESEALRLGAALGELARAGRDKCTFITSPGIASFSLWVEQLIAESTGKLGTGIVPIAGEPLGVPRQYGDDRVFVQFRLAGDDNSEQDALVSELSAAGEPVITIELADEYDIGREFFRWEFAIAVAGHVLGINPFDEPNVQESKDNTCRVLNEFEASGTLDRPGIPERRWPVAVMADGRIQPDIYKAFSELVAVLVRPAYLAITAYIEATDAADQAFGAMRADVRHAQHTATTIGYGPRFLHSTGQLHKGGTPLGAFLQVTADDAEDVAIPGRPFSFGQLKRAQAIGDFESLVAHGRPVVRVHVGRDITSGLASLREAVADATRDDAFA